MFPLLMAMAGWLLLCAQAADPPPGPREIEVRGRLVCLHEEMHRLHGTDLPTRHTRVPGFRAVDGSFYTLLRTKFSLALFDDERLQSRELILRGRLFPKSHVFEPTDMKSVSNGTTHSLYYYCNICAINTLDPGPCACCQEPVELIEKPL